MSMFLPIFVPLALSIVVLSCLALYYFVPANTNTCEMDRNERLLCFVRRLHIDWNRIQKHAEPQQILLFQPQLRMKTVKQEKKNTHIKPNVPQLKNIEAREMGFLREKNERRTLIKRVRPKNWAKIKMNASLALSYTHVEQWKPKIKHTQHKHSEPVEWPW